MGFWSRFTNVFRGDRLSRDIDEELQSHLDEAIFQGRTGSEARRALGPALRYREESRGVKAIVWLDALRADAVFGLRQLRKKKVASAAAILSLALAIGACTSAFRLIDAMLLRPLPVAHPERLYLLSRENISVDGSFRKDDGFEHPVFRNMRAAVTGQAELIAMSVAEPTELTFGSNHEMEKAYRQYVSGWMFPVFGLRPALGRLFTEDDDRTPGAHPFAVLSYDYWSRRFGKDPAVIGRTFRRGNRVFEIAGVSEEGFTGTEPGTVTDIFLPSMMHGGVNETDWPWARIWVRVNPGVSPGPVCDRLKPVLRSFQEQRMKGYPGMPKQMAEGFLNEPLFIEPAAAGISKLQREFRQPLEALAALVALVLLIACANVANLMAGQAAARAREMALRVSIGAGRWRLVQLVLVESAWLGFLSAAAGSLFAWWSAPLVVRMINPPDNPARLVLPADWRVFGFGLALSVIVTLLFGLMPALAASAIKPASALKGGEAPHSRGRMMHGLIGAQIAFCFLTLFVGGLFVATFERLANRPTGFSAQRVLAFDTIGQGDVSLAAWVQAIDRLRAAPGVESAAWGGYPLLSGNLWNGAISINGAPANGSLVYFLFISPGWLETMKIPLLSGRDFRPGDVYPGPAIVNQAFAKQYFNGENPVGKVFDRTNSDGTRRHLQIVGVAGDSINRSMREPVTPTVYISFDLTGEHLTFSALGDGVLLVRTSSTDPLSLAPFLRREITSARPELRVRSIRTQQEINRSQTVRERLLATLALFFASVALVLAGVGMYGVLDYSVVQRRREIGIRMALGARGRDVARRVIAEVLIMVAGGAVAGIVAGMVSIRYIETLFYQAKGTDLDMLTLPAVAIFVAALLAAAAPVTRAVRLDPVTMLRME